MKKKRFTSISFKFTSWYLAILAVLLLVLGCGVYFSLSRRMYDNLDNTLLERAEQIVRFKDVIGIVARGAFEEEPGEILSFYYTTKDNRIEDLSHKGRKIAVKTEWIDQILNDGASGFSFATTPDGIKVRLYSMLYLPQDAGNKANVVEKRPLLPNFLESNTHQPAPRVEPDYRGVKIDKAALVIARTTKNIELTLEQLFQTLVLVLPLTLFLMGCCGIFFLRIILRPVQHITETAKEIEAKDLSRRIMVTTQDELGRLASTINHMIARLEKAFLRQKELTGDASHELRAPLAVIQAEATLALQREREAPSYQRSLEIIAKESDHMAAIIGQLLFLARADSGHEQANLTDLDLAPFLQDVCTGIEPLCHEKQQTLEFHSIELVTVRGDGSLLRTVILNLLRNAIQHTPEGGKISVSLERENAMARICVADSGTGIPEDALSYIFNRFYRVDKARSRESGGSGLGLAICKHVVNLHHGQIHVSSQFDQGTSFVVTLPLAGDL